MAISTITVKLSPPEMRVIHSALDAYADELKRQTDCARPADKRGLQAESIRVADLVKAFK